MTKIIRMAIFPAAARGHGWWRGALLGWVLTVCAFGASGTGRPQELTWDDRERAFFGQPGETEAKFTFTVTNETGMDVTIFRIQPSCGCTTVDLPPTPWILAPGASGTMRVAVNLKDKFGKIEKTLSVDSSLNRDTLLLRLFLPAMTTETDPRARNQRTARADRQAVFHGDCARCHVPPATVVGGAALFRAACAICHEAPRRAAMVPDLAVAKAGRDVAYWTLWASEGRADSLMPAFATMNGGVLSAEQIRELVADLLVRFDPTCSGLEIGQHDRPDRDVAAPPAK